MGRLGRGQRWAAAGRRRVVPRVFRGEPLDLVSRELGVEPYRLEKWWEDALAGREEALKAGTICYRGQKTRFFQELGFVAGDGKGGNGRLHLFQVVEYAAIDGRFFIRVVHRQLFRHC